MNALAAANGQGDCIYIYPVLPCTQCLSHLIQSKVKRIVTWDKLVKVPSKWDPQLVLSLAEEAGIEVDFVTL